MFLGYGGPSVLNLLMRNELALTQRYKRFMRFMDQLCTTFAEHLAEVCVNAGWHQNWHFGTGPVGGTRDPKVQIQTEVGKPEKVLSVWTTQFLVNECRSSN